METHGRENGEKFFHFILWNLPAGSTGVSKYFSLMYASLAGPRLGTCAYGSTHDGVGTGRAYSVPRS